MENYLQKFPKIDGVWAGDDDVLTGALKAVEEAKRQDIQVMIGGGGAKTMVKRVMDGDRYVKATVTYPPAMIRTAMETAAEAPPDAEGGNHRALGDRAQGKRESALLPGFGLLTPA